MAGITTTWDIAVPAGSEDPKNGDNRICELKTSLEEIFRNGGHRLVAGPSTDLKLGRHVCDEEFASGGSGTPLTGEFYIYAKDGTTRIVVVRDSTAASASQFDITGLQLKGTGGLAVTGTASLGATTAMSLITTTTANIGGAMSVTGQTTVSDLIKPNANNTIDLGVDTTNAWRDLFVARNAKIGGTLAVTGVATFTAVPVFNGGITVATSFTLSGASQVTGITTQNASGSYSVVATDRLILCTHTSGTLTVNLPAAASSTGRELWIAIGVYTGTGVVTIDGNGAEQVHGAASFSLNRTAGSGARAAHIVCDGTAWHIAAYTSNAI